LIRINLLTAYFPPQRSAGANRLSGFARAFRDQGLDVRVFAARYAGDHSLAPNDHDLEPLTVWVDCKPVRRVGFLRRFIDEWTVARKIYGAARTRDCEIVIATTPFLSFLLIGPTRVPRNKLIFDVRDLTWEYRISAPKLISILQKVLAYWAVWCLGRARLVVTATEPEQAYVQKQLPNAEVIQVANGIERATFDQLHELTKQASRSDTHRVLYAGVLGVAQGVSILAEAAATLPDWRFTIIGDGVEKEPLKKSCLHHKLTNLEMLGSLPREVVFSHYAAATVLFVRLRPGFETAVPSKVYEYLATGKPVVYMGAATDAAWQLLSQFTGTFRADDCDTVALVNQFRIAANPEVSATSANRSALKAFTRESQAAKLIDRVRLLQA